MNMLVLTVNILGWPVIHLALARLFLSIPDAYFAHDSWLTRERSLEHGGETYRRLFAVQRWKELLPDGAPWLGGRAKKRVASRDPEQLNLFMIETRRGEAAHWSMLLCTPVFFIWNPAWACVVMTVYGLAANFPCILVQRANRIKAAHILSANTTRHFSTLQL
jgi:glycosyl-4,4'-diaponeurosporenoate acyltransferase